jgi:hypothetical protein
MCADAMMNVDGGKLAINLLANLHQQIQQHAGIHATAESQGKLPPTCRMQIEERDQVVGQVKTLP